LTWSVYPYRDHIGTERQVGKITISMLMTRHLGATEAGDQ
jgi:hypothetical protein